MTDEERRIITAFVERISGAAPIQGAPSGPWGATGAAQVPNLPPLDPEADRLIAELFARHPEARYRITQTAFATEAALIEASNRIQQLEWEVEAAQRQGQAQAAQAGGGGMFGGLFGGRSNAQMPPPMPPRPRPQYPAGYNPQAMAQQGRGGMGFLGTAAAAAAGVVGGMMLGNLLMSAMGGGAAAAATPAADATPVADQGGYDAAPAEQDAWAAADDGGDWGGDEEI
ncbi:DUF2076 family protein [Roseomonas sp. HF4]|uniref:DUF2076 domain-containing protein n=1 Tax=Roseomonas sp. HF4 TaxID=2562313 RepID=UPI0010C015B3|nr:DUF2076 family protein [Roseomonas sp. HF4]